MIKGRDDAFKGRNSNGSVSFGVRRSRRGRRPFRHLLRRGFNGADSHRLNQEKSKRHMAAFRPRFDTVSHMWQMSLPRRGGRVNIRRRSGRGKCGRFTEPCDAMMIAVYTHDPVIWQMGRDRGRSSMVNDVRFFFRLSNSNFEQSLYPRVEGYIH